MVKGIPTTSSCCHLRSTLPVCSTASSRSIAGGGWHSLCRMNTDTDQYVMKIVILSSLYCVHYLNLNIHVIVQMIKSLKILLSSRSEDGKTVGYVEKLFDSEDGSVAINNNLFVGCYLLLNLP